MNEYDNCNNCSNYGRECNCRNRCCCKCEHHEDRCNHNNECECKVRQNNCCNICSCLKRLFCGCCNRR